MFWLRLRDGSGCQCSCLLADAGFVAVQDNTASAGNYSSNRPKEKQRLFRSTAVEKEIARVQKLLKNRKLSWMFANCFPNTLDTTVHFRKGSDGKPDTFVYTGDIHAMWLRDSGAQVWPYVQLANNDPKLKEMLLVLFCASSSASISTRMRMPTTTVRCPMGIG